MAVINLTLDNLRLPGLPNFTPDFGTKESEGVSVNTENVCKDIMLPFTVERPVFVNENSSTSEVQTSRTLILVQSAITLSIGRPSFASCKLTLKAAFVSGFATVTYSKAENVTQTIYLRPGDSVELVGNTSLYFEVNSDATVGEHNGIFRGKCLNGAPESLYPILPIGNTKYLPGGGYTIEQVLANIAAGNFTDIYPGDYFIDSDNKVYRIAGLDTELNKGETPLTSHHAVIVTDFALTNMGWNPTNTTAGGYQVSAVQAYCDGAGQAAVESVFGAAHVLTVRDLLSSDMNASAASPGYSAWQGEASSWGWSSHKVRLMSEVEVYGARLWSGGFDIGSANEQFPLFRLMPQLATGLRYDYWLSGIASAVDACYVNLSGYAGNYGASSALGVRVRFLLG